MFHLNYVKIQEVTLKQTEIHRKNTCHVGNAWANLRAKVPVM